MKKGLLLSVLMFLIGTQITVNAHGNTNHLDSGNTKLIICVANNDATAPIDTIFTEDDIQWFNDSTREIRFKEPLQQVREKLWSKSKNLEFRLGENVLFKATRTSNVMSSTVHDLVLCYGSEVKASIKGFFLYDCYPKKLLNDEQVQANIQKRAPQWEIFLDYLKSKNMIDNHGIVNIDGLDYELDEIAHTAQLTSGKTWEGELNIPSKVSYNEEEFIVTSIGEKAFEGCSGLTSVTIPESVTGLGVYAFLSSGLTSVTIPNSVTSIGGGAFANCKKLISITFPRSVTSMGGLVIDKCSGLESIRIEDGNPVYDSRGNCNAIIRTATNELLAGCRNTIIPESVTNIESHAFYECTGLTSITIPETITSIGDYAFSGCYMLTSVTMPNSVTSIGDGAFDGCSGLTSVTIPEGVTKLGRYVFYGCPLFSVIIPNSVTEIGEKAFYGCFELKSLTIGSGVTTIQSKAFMKCANLTDIYCLADNVPETSSNAFSDSPIASATLHVPAGSVDKYKATEPWSNFGNIEPLPDPVTFTEGQMATIILPTTPDASKGKYYRLDRCEDGKIIFEQEPTPKAHTPYIIVPNQDFNIDLSTLDLEGCRRDSTKIVGVSFIGTYSRDVFGYKDSFYYYILDSTPDCRNEEGESVYVGPLHAFLEIDWRKNNHQNYEKMEVVLHDKPEAYRPFVEEGKVWKVGGEVSGNLVQWVEYNYFDGDTIIDGKTCKQMMRQLYVSPDHPDYAIISQWPSLSYVGAWYEEDKKVYEYDTTSKQLKLMYDFSLNAYDTLQIDNQFYVVEPRQTGGINGFKGVYRDVWECGVGESIIYRCAPWLEGVGGVYGPPTLNVFNVELADPIWFLMSCTVGDEVIYLNDEYEDGATPDAVEARKVRFDFTHTVKTQPKAPKKKVTEKSLYGEYNAQQLDINLDPLDDTYQVRITDASGKAVYEKNINAGNIVGLNIDISAYTKGLYTVTVENSQESFTGEFNANTTGIEINEMKNERVKNEKYDDAIYDLQGRKINSQFSIFNYQLKKGLYIVNGKKVIKH